MKLLKSFSSSSREDDSLLLLDQDCPWVTQGVRLLFCYIRSSCAVSWLPYVPPKCPEALIVATAEILGFWLGWTSHILCEKIWRKEKGWFSLESSSQRQNMDMSQSEMAVMDPDPALALKICSHALKQCNQLAINND